MQYKIEEINNAGFGDSIISVFSVPICSVVGYTDYNSNEWTMTYLWGHINSFGDWISTFTADPSEIYYPESFGYNDNLFEGYNIKNKKLLHYPFHYLGFNPPNGAQKIFRYEDFSNGYVNGVYDATKKSKFYLISEINPNPTPYLIPFNYKKSKETYVDPSLAYAEACAISGYPTISYITDYFNSWLAQNSGIINVQMRQEEYNYEHNVAIDTAKNITGAVSRFRKCNIKWKYRFCNYYTVQIML